MIRMLPTVAESFSSAGSRVSATSDIYRLSQHGEFHMEAGALAWLALDANLASVFLDDAVRNGEPQPSATAPALRGTTLGGEEWIVDAMDVPGRDAAAGITHLDVNGAAIHSRDFEAAAAGHGGLCIEEQVQEHLLQLASVSVDQRKLRCEIAFDFDA